MIDAIERSVEEASQTLGVPPSKRQIVVSIPNPIVYKQPIAQKGGTTYWGVIDQPAYWTFRTKPTAHWPAAGISTKC